MLRPRYMTSTKNNDLYNQNWITEMLGAKSKVLFLFAGRNMKIFTLLGSDLARCHCPPGSDPRPWHLYAH